MLSYAQQLLRAISGARKQCQKTEVTIKLQPVSGVQGPWAALNSSCSNFNASGPVRGYRIQSGACVSDRDEKIQRIFRFIKLGINPDENEAAVSTYHHP